MKKVAGLYGLETFALKMDYEALLALYQAACPGGDSPQNAGTVPSCSFRMVLHINGNHYITVTKVTADSVTYIDPGAGPEADQQRVTLSKTEFLQIWEGTVLSARAPPESFLTSDGIAPNSSARLNVRYEVLSEREQKQIRGAFFWFFIPVLIAIAQAVAAAIKLLRLT